MDFSGNWTPEVAHKDLGTSKPLMGWTITYASCPISWVSKMRTEVALSTTEAKYIALSTALREQIPLLELLKEVISKGIDVHLQPPVIKCQAFEDNSGALEMANLPKIVLKLSTSTFVITVMTMSNTVKLKLLQSPPNTKWLIS